MSVILNYARHMPPDIRFDVLYFVETGDDREEELTSLGGTATRITSPGLHSFRRDDVDEYLAAHRGEYAAIHLHLPYLASVFAPKARKYGIPRVIVHCHTSCFSLERNGWRNRILNLPTKIVANDLLACSYDAGCVWFGRRAMEYGRVVVLPNAIECELFRFTPSIRQAVRQELKLDGHFVAGHVGTLSKPKNHTFLLRVFAELCGRRENAVLLLVGEGVLRGRIMAQAEELGLRDKVVFLGNREDVPQLLQAMDVFFFPSLHEGLGIAAVEAQVAGLPTLVSEAIPAEACVTNRVYRLPLNAHPSLWAETALELAALQRDDCISQVEATCFDLRKSSSWLAAFYKKSGETEDDIYS